MRSNPSRSARAKRTPTPHSNPDPTPKANTAVARESIYDSVTARIIADLEQGCVPWVRPWGKVEGGPGIGLPHNATTRRPYSGINILILWGEVIAKAYPTQGWLTFQQARAAGGIVRKGERGVTVVYADRFTPKGRNDSGDGQTAPSAPNARGDARTTPDTEPRSVAFLKRFTVFNVAQCDGLDPRFTARPTPPPERQIVAEAEALIVASGVDFRIGGDRAFYAPDPDVVMVPPQPAFFDQINYYRTALHELTHATGHPARLARDLKNAFGSKDYAREELVAEMGAAFLCATLGITPTVRHADYIGSWLTVLREDSRAIFRAASAASRAADWLLTRHADAQEAAQARAISGRVAA